MRVGPQRQVRISSRFRTSSWIRHVFDMRSMCAHGPLGNSAEQCGRREEGVTLCSEIQFPHTVRGVARSSPLLENPGLGSGSRLRYVCEPYRLVANAFGVLDSVAF